MIFFFVCVPPGAKTRQGSPRHAIFNSFSEVFIHLATKKRKGGATRILQQQQKGKIGKAAVRGGCGSTSPLRQPARKQISSKKFFFNLLHTQHRQNPATSTLPPPTETIASNFDAVILRRTTSLRPQTQQLYTSTVVRGVALITSSASLHHREGSVDGPLLLPRPFLRHSTNTTQLKTNKTLDAVFGKSGLSLSPSVPLTKLEGH